MNAKLTKWLVFACGILLLIIFAEWQYYTYSKKQLFAKTSTDSEGNYISGELPQIKLGQKVEESYVEMVNRPLFIEGRKPVEEPEGEDEEQTAVSAEEFDWILDGVYIHENTSMALFSRAKARPDQEKFLKMEKGGTIEGWDLIEIQPDKVVLDQKGKRHELTLIKPKPTKQPPQPVVRAVPKTKTVNKPSSKPVNNPFKPRQPVENPFLKKITK